MDPEGIRSLELVGHRTWPSLEDEWHEGWLLRAGGGVTRRSNSASFVHSAGAAVNLDTQVAWIEKWFRRRRLPPIFRLTALATGMDALLDKRGYLRDVGAVIMTRTIDGFPAGEMAAGLSDRPSQGWLELMAHEPGRGGDQRAALERLLARIGLPARYASIERDGRTVAIGLAVVADDQAALFMMQTVPDLRRTGLGQSIAAALLEWAAGEGARRSLLQVRPDNPAALAFYGSLGYQPRYEYWYRQ